MIRYVIHAVGPVWKGGTQNEPEELRNAVRNSLLKAKELDVKSIAIPAISSGIFGYPKPNCAYEIISTVIKFCEEEKEGNPSEIHLTNFDEETVSIFEKTFKILVKTQ